MKTREIAAAYRLTHWAGIIRRRIETGQNIREFCKSEGIHENTYFYWQKKLREAAAEKLQLPQANGIENKAIPGGWALCALPGTESSAEPKEKSIYIEIGKCRIKATAETDMETLVKVCGALVKIC